MLGINEQRLSGVNLPYKIHTKPTATVPCGELWPSLGEYPVYDQFLYARMTHDAIRNDSYAEAIAAHARDVVALDIGTGQDALWARACVNAGAHHVYAVEQLRSAYERAQHGLRASADSSRITLLYGPASAIELPERVGLCVSEIIGSVASAEGVIGTINDARHRLMKSDAVVIPRRCDSLIAAVELTSELRMNPWFPADAVRYITDIFEMAGRPFDLRLCVAHLGDEHVLSSHELIETLDFSSLISESEQKSARLAITRDGVLDGFIVWPRIWIAHSVSIDALAQNTSWSPLYIPAFYPGIDVGEGDSIDLVWRRRLSADGIHPDYFVRGILREAAGRVRAFNCSIPYVGTSFRSTAFYQALFPA